MMEKKELYGIKLPPNETKLLRVRINSSKKHIRYLPFLQNDINNFLEKIKISTNFILISIVSAITLLKKWRFFSRCCTNDLW